MDQVGPNSVGNDLPAARAYVAACGTQTALIAANGGPSQQ